MRKISSGSVPQSELCISITGCSRARWGRHGSVTGAGRAGRRRPRPALKGKQPCLVTQRASGSRRLITGDSAQVRVLRFCRSGSEVLRLFRLGWMTEMFVVSGFIWVCLDSGSGSFHFPFLCSSCVSFVGIVSYFACFDSLLKSSLKPLIGRFTTSVGDKSVGWFSHVSVSIAGQNRVCLDRNLKPDARTSSFCPNGDPLKSEESEPRLKPSTRTRPSSE